MDVNANGVFLGTKAAIPEMRKAGGGSIVNISSIAGLVGGTSNAYGASKGAVRIFTKSTAIQYAREGIRANSVHPGGHRHSHDSGYPRRRGRPPSQPGSTSHRQAGHTRRCGLRRALSGFRTNLHLSPAANWLSMAASLPNRLPRLAPGRLSCPSAAIDRVGRRYRNDKGVGARMEDSNSAMTYGRF